MAKKPTKKAASPAKSNDAIAVTATAETVASLVLIVVPANGTLRVIVDVGPMTIPYTVAYAGHTIIKSLVDRSELVVPLIPGDNLLAWAFSHTEKGWSHTIGVSVDDGPIQVLEQKSEANKDQDHSIGSAVVRV